MTEKTQTPDRIKPFYETLEPGQDFLLIDEDGATLKQGDNEVKGKVTITQEWSPMGLYWEFTGTDFDVFSIGEVEVELKSKSFKAKGRLFSQGKHSVAGYFEGKTEIGTDHKLNRVTFHLANYPDIFGGEQYHDKIIKDGTTTSLSWSQVALEYNDWRITLQPYQNIFELRQKGRESQKVVLSGVGEIRKSDGSQFKKKMMKPILEALRIFLSFAFAEWSPPLLAVGSNDVAEKSCQFWGNYDILPRPYLRGWLDEHNGQHLANAFPGFMARWSNENWQEPLILAVTWLIEASRQSGGTEGAIAFGQIPLEMLAWLVFVDDRTIVAPDEFDRLSAASKLQLLLAHCGIPFEVPAGLSTLAKIATEQQKKSGKDVTGPQLVTTVRNTIIHPNKKNREILAGWEKDYSVKVSDIRWDTQQLFKWYITLVLLSLIGYSGKYANRLTPHNIGDVESVPWAPPASQETAE
ncbi:hypothetical protein Pan258_29660 [Symmachiella dynata]|uniref:hypothetical protein n=1 Tax=Symmachiella dynata TaxID=2527995 RepID=UPI00118B7A7E|nr:hypothetical protein [Symmachiella dynata]QDT48919.1 hypothetical protein Pan258_29660 [Symmachiella dynata]